MNCSLVSLQRREKGAAGQRCLAAFYFPKFESLAILYIADLIFMWYRNHILFMVQPRRKHDLSGREEISKML